MPDETKHLRAMLRAAAHDIRVLADTLAAAGLDAHAAQARETAQFYDKQGRGMAPHAQRRVA